MNAITMLEKQHRKVEAIFSKLEKKHPDCESLVAELAANLAAHMAIEQEIFYPAAKAVNAKLVLESYEEHSLAELALKRLMRTDASSEDFAPRVTATKELIEHHVKEEEEDLFPKVAEALGEEKLEMLGNRMKERFEEVIAEGFEQSVPKSFTKTSADVSRKKIYKNSHGTAHV